MRLSTTELRRRRAGILDAFRRGLDAKPLSMRDKMATWSSLRRHPSQRQQDLQLS